MNPLTMTSPQTAALKTGTPSFQGALHTPRTNEVPLSDIDPSQVKNYDKITAKAKEFESVFLAEMMKPMFESVDVDPLFGGGNAENIFRGMLTEEYGKKIASTKGIGIADYVTRELIRAQQEAEHGR